MSDIENGNQSNKLLTDNNSEEQHIKIYFPEIKDVNKYEIKWECLLFFRHALKKLHMQKVTFGELSLAKIKIIELQHIETKETVDLYFNLVDVFCNSEFCQSNDIWENCKISYTIIKKLSDFYEYDDVLQKYKQNTEVFSIFKTKNKKSSKMINENINFYDEKYNNYKEDFKDIENKINNLVKYDNVFSMDGSMEDLSESAGVFKSQARDLHSRNVLNSCMNYNWSEKIKDAIFYIILFTWLIDIFKCIISFIQITERNPETEEQPLEDIRTLLFKSEFNRESNEKMSQQLSQFVIDKLDILGNTDIGFDEVNEYCKNIIIKVTEHIEKGVPHEEWLSRFIIPRVVLPFDDMKSIEYKWTPDKYLQIANEYDYNNDHISNKPFIYFNNYGLKAIQNEVENFINEHLNDDIMELNLPDIYILSGFKKYPTIYEKDFYSKFNFKTSECIDKTNDLLKHKWWFPFFSLVCFISQIVGPIYYIVEYFLYSDNEICPNRSEISTKLFATCYYLLLYAQFSKMWDEISITCAQYDNVEITKHKNYIIGSWVINNICLIIIPFFTYTLFIEHNELTDLILNCLTGQFLIDIDNLVVTFSSGDFFMKKFIKDKILLEYINNGVNTNNVMNEDSLLQTSFNILGIIQAYSTIILSIVIARCI